MLRIREYLDDTFLMTFGDGVADIDIDRDHRGSTRPTAGSRP